MKRMPSPHNVLSALAVAATLSLIATPATAAVDITLDMNSLPSAQGWTYFADAGPAETSVFSVSGGTLLQDATPGNGAWYELNGVVEPNLSFNLSMRARVTSGGLGFATYVALDGLHTALLFSPESIYVFDSATNLILLASVDNTEFHDYRMTGTPGGGYNVFVDNTMIGSWEFTPYPAINALLLGDPGSSGNATAEVTSFRFTQPAVPLPGAVLLLASALAPLVLRLRKTRR